MFTYCTIKIGEFCVKFTEKSGTILAKYNSG